MYSDAELRRLVDENTRTEVECGLQLFLALDGPKSNKLAAFLPTSILDAESARNATIVNMGQEARLRGGRTDFSVVAKARSAMGLETTFCVVWEFKAPQISAFNRKTAAMWSPSDGLMEAEVQLSSYVDELKSSGVRLPDGSTLNNEQIMFGGIIIGRDAERPSYGSLEYIKYSQACQIRTTYFHRHNCISLFNWDHVFRILTS